MTGRPTTSGASNFPAANLPPSALAWARAVMQRVAQLEEQNTRQDGRILDLNHSLVGTLRGGADAGIYTPSGVIVPPNAAVVNGVNESFGPWGLEQSIDLVSGNSLHFQNAMQFGSASNFGLELHSFSNEYNGYQLHHGYPGGEETVDHGNALFISNYDVQLKEMLDGTPATVWLEARIDGRGYPYLGMMRDNFDGESSGSPVFQIIHNPSTGHWQVYLNGATLDHGWYDTLIARSLPVSATTGQVLTWNGTAWTGQAPAVSGEQHDFGSAGQWTVNHSIGRIPSVTVYDASGNLLLAEAAATSTQVVITFANPTAGSVVLT